MAYRKEDRCFIVSRESNNINDLLSESTKLPRHVAIIMDGNGRWAKKHKVKVALGHKTGVEALRHIIRATSDLRIEALSIYAFSTENWTRSKDEIDALMSLLLIFFDSEIDELYEKNVCIRILGDKDGLPQAQRRAVMAAEARTGNNTGLKLNIALNYGAQQEILQAVQQIALSVKEERLLLSEISKEAFEDRLYTHGLPEVDLLIRTSGEMRLSNFLLYQCAYAEFVFPEVLWPDFTLAHYVSILRDYGSRDRRFGGRKA